MKKYLILGGVVLVLLILFGLWKFSSKSESVVIQSETGKLEMPITINPLELTVSITTATSSTFKAIIGETKTTVGSKVKTGSSGRALIESSSAHQTLIDYNTEITITDDSKSEKKTKIALVSGAVWARLGKVFDSGEYYEIKTSNAVATVRGTSFGVWYKNGVTTVVVTEGSIYLSAVDPATGMVIPNSEVVIKAGEKAAVDEKGKIVISKITTADRNEPWHIYNNPEDKTAVIIIPKPVPVPPPTKTPTTSPTPTPAPQETPFAISSIVPTTADNGPGTIVTLKGSGFTKLKSIVIGRYSVMSYRISSATSIQLMTEGIAPGTYDVYLVDLNNNTVRASNQLTITAAPPVETPPNTNIYYVAPGQ